MPPSPAHLRLVETFTAPGFAYYKTPLRPASGNAVLSGRAVARILHRLPSPAFPKKAWEKTRFWGLHRDVDFGLLRRIADEALETARRRALQQQQQQGRKRQRVP